MIIINSLLSLGKPWKIKFPGNVALYSTIIDVAFKRFSIFVSLSFKDVFLYAFIRLVIPPIRETLTYRYRLSETF